MRKTKREYLKMCQSEGVDLLHIGHTGSGHIRLEFDAGCVIASSTPSDYRATRKVRADIRNLHR